MVTKEYSVQIKFKKQALFKSKQRGQKNPLMSMGLMTGMWKCCSFWYKTDGRYSRWYSDILEKNDSFKLLPSGSCFLPGKCLWQQLHCLCAFITCLAEGSCAWSASLCIIAVISSAIFTKTDFFLSDAHCETDTFSQHCLPSRQAAHPLLFLIGRLRYHYSLCHKTLLLI